MNTVFNSDQARLPTDDDAPFYLLMSDHGEWLRIDPSFYSDMDHFERALGFKEAFTVLGNGDPSDEHRAVMWFTSRTPMTEPVMHTNIGATAIVRTLQPKYKDGKTEVRGFAVFTGPCSHLTLVDNERPSPLSEESEASIAAYCALTRRTLNVNMSAITAARLSEMKEMSR